MRRNLFQTVTAISATRKRHRRNRSPSLRVPVLSITSIKGIDSGHYTSICQTQHSRNWFNYDNDLVSVSKFLKMKQKDRVLENHTRMATMLFYVSTELQIGNGSQVPIAYLTNDANERGSSQPTTNPAMATGQQQNWLEKILTREEMDLRNVCPHSTISTI